MRTDLCGFASLWLLLGSAAAAEPDGPTPDPSKIPCPRSVRGDVESARKHLDQGRIDAAAVYLDGLAECGAAWIDLEFLLLRVDVKEEQGALNVAWSAGYAALRLAEQRGAATSIAPIRQRMDLFRATYAILLAPVGVRPPVPRVRYLGPYPDKITLLLVSEVDTLTPVLLGDLPDLAQASGHWLLPGQYEIEGQTAELRAGAIHPPTVRPSAVSPPLPPPWSVPWPPTAPPQPTPAPVLSPPEP